MDIILEHDHVIPHHEKDTDVIGIVILSPNKEITLLFYDLSPHRARVVIQAYNSGKLQQVHPMVFENYINNGYTTRRGLFVKYTNEDLLKMEKIGRSHADYLGSETGDSSQDHYNRVRIRNF